MKERWQEKVVRREVSYWSPVHLQRALLALTVLGILGGLVIVYSASYPYALSEFGNPFAILIRQVAYTVLGLCFLLIALKIPLQPLQRFGWLLHLPVIFFLVATLVAGKKVGEAQRWLALGSFQFQPSEFAKVTLIVFIASLAAHWRNASTLKQKFGIWVAIFAFWLLTVALVLAQPHLSGGLLLAVIGLLVMFFARLPISLIVASLLFVVPMGYIGQKHFLHPYQQKRWQVGSWLTRSNDSSDPKAYQMRQALLGIQVGGWFGQGLNQSRQKHLFLPSAHNDFVFSVIGEEFGFAGSFIVIAFFAFLAYFGLCVATQAPNAFSSGLAGSVAFSIWMQAILHISVNANLLPPTGVPLPFASAGGSSLCATLLGMGLLLNVSATNIKRNEAKRRGGVNDALGDGRWRDRGTHLSSPRPRHRRQNFTA